MQGSLFDDRTALIPGLAYTPELITPDDEQDLLRVCATIEFSKVEMRGGVARRRTMHYGWSYGYYSRRTSPGTPLPPFLLPLRRRAGEWAGIEAEALAEALITEYTPGAPIGWHRDAPMFGDIVGISLRSACRMKFRPYVSPAEIAPGAPPRRTTHELQLEPRSAYVMRGVVRRDYEHSIPPVDELRYSVTFRTVVAR